MPELRTFRSGIYDFSDSRVVGPGIWFSFLHIAIDSKTQQELMYACKHIRTVCAAMKCETCRLHSTDHIQKFPPEREIAKEQGLFYWIVNLMNKVNQRNGKELYDPVTLYKTLTSEESCAEDCAIETSPVTVRIGSDATSRNNRALQQMNQTLNGVIVVVRDGQTRPYANNTQTSRSYTTNNAQTSRFINY